MSDYEVCLTVSDCEMVNWSDDYPATNAVRPADVTAAAEQIGALICRNGQLERLLHEVVAKENDLRLEVIMLRGLLSRLPDETESDKAAVVSPVQQHVDAIVQDLVSGSVTTVQRGTLRDALNNAAIGSITRRG